MSGPDEGHEEGVEGGSMLALNHQTDSAGVMVTGDFGQARFRVLADHTAWARTFSLDRVRGKNKLALIAPNTDL